MVKLETSLRYASLFLKGLATWPLSSHASNLERALQTSQAFFIVLVLCSAFFGMTMFAIKNANDAMEITQVVSTQVLTVHGIVTVIVFKSYGETVRRLVKSVRNSIENGSEKLLTHLHRYASNGNMIYGMFTAACFFVALDLALEPLFKSGRTLPVNIWYPFDYEGTASLYAVAYLHQMMIIMMCLMTPGYDVVFGLFVFHCCAHLNVLQEDLINLTEDLADDDDYSGNELKRRISNCVRCHCNIMSDIEDINNIYTNIVLVLLLLATIAICCTGIQVATGGAQSGNTLVVFAVLACCNLVQILIYYWPGNMLNDETEGVGSAAYFSGWELMPSDQRKDILLMILRSAKGANLQVGRSGLLLLENYTGFLTTTASYFTTLQVVVGIA